MSDDKFKKSSGWNSFLGKTKEQVTFYRWTTILCAVAAIISISGCIYFSSQVKYVPFVVEVNKDYAPLQVHQLESLGQSKDAVTRSQLAAIIKNMRVVYAGDKEAQLDAIKSVYYFIKTNSQPYKYVQEMFSVDDPMNQKFLNQVEIKAILPLSKDTWRAEWVEKKAMPDGKNVLSRNYSAVIQVEYADTISAEMIINNPIGLYPKNMQITEEYK